MWSAFTHWPILPALFRNFETVLLSRAGWCQTHYVAQADFKRKGFLAILEDVNRKFPSLPLLIVFQIQTVVPGSNVIEK